MSSVWLYGHFSVLMDPAFILIRTPVLWVRAPCQRPCFNLITSLETLSPNIVASCYLEAKLQCVNFKSSQCSSEQVL